MLPAYYFQLQFCTCREEGYSTFLFTILILIQLVYFEYRY